MQIEYARKNLRFTLYLTICYIRVHYIKVWLYNYIWQFVISMFIASRFDCIIAVLWGKERLAKSRQYPRWHIFVSFTRQQGHSNHARNVQQCDLAIQPTIRVCKSKGTTACVSSERSSREQQVSIKQVPLWQRTHWEHESNTKHFDQMVDKACRPFSVNTKFKNLCIPMHVIQYAPMSSNYLRQANQSVSEAFTAKWGEITHPPLTPVSQVRIKLRVPQFVTVTPCTNKGKIVQA